MFEINLICVGKLKEKFYQAAVEEYCKRLGGICKLKITELPEIRLPDSPSISEINNALDKEAALIREKIPKCAWFCVFTPEGRLISSEDLAKKLTDLKSTGKSNACFLIGSSYGMAKSIKEEADYMLSMSPMTFPHHLARIMVLEQLYRAEMINKGSKYHK